MIELFTTNSFAEESGGGNPAAVVFDADHLTEEQMQKIAIEIGYSETAFVMKSQRADIRIRYFTPVREVDLCGHATIAVFALLKDLNMLTKEYCTLETEKEVLQIVQRQGRVMMEMSKPKFFEVPDREKVADSLNLKLEELDSDHLPQFVSTGLKDLIIPVKTRKILDQVKPDFQKIIELSKAYGAEGYHLYSLDGQSCTAYTRNFAPTLGIMEESATGTASGALAAYLYEYGLLKGIQAESMVFVQGEAMGRPSVIHVNLETKEQKIYRIFVGGTVKDTIARSIEI